MRSHFRTLSTLIVLLICIAAVCVFGSALADEVNPLRVAMQVSQSDFTEPTEITVSIRISNVGEDTLPGAVTLYYPSGKQIEEFGAPVLESGASKSWSGTIDVTQAMLDAGKITFKVKYSMYNEAGELVSKSRNFSKEITYTGGVASIEVNRTITPTTAGKGQEVSITYDIVNTGTLDVTDVTITENASISSKKGIIDKVAAGEKDSTTFTVTMGTKDLTSQASISYRAAGKTETVTKEATTIKYTDIKLKATLSSDKKGGTPGETVKLTLKLANSGKSDYRNISVTDPILGLVFSGETAPAGKTTTLEKEVTIADTIDYQFQITATDGSDAEIETASNRLTLTAVRPEDAITLSVVAEADRDVVYTVPGTVRFKVHVTNNSTADVSDVSVSASGVTLYTFPSILSGETRDFTRDVSISMGGQFQFVARVRNQLGETSSFESNIIRISEAVPTPVPTEVPIVTPPRPNLQQLPTEDDLDENLKLLQEPLLTAGYVFLALFAVFLVVLFAAALRRSALKRESAAALDHLSEGGARNYTAPGNNTFLPETEANVQTAEAVNNPEPEEGENTDPTFENTDDPVQI
ncbi:MAG: hypothetical protein IJ229_12340 [Clostridia bacterium]|nr:hypothetical protein [Clostridia bacterium]